MHARFDDAEAALSQVQAIYRSSVEHLRSALKERIERLAEQARSGAETAITIKVNALVDRRPDLRVLIRSSASAWLVERTDLPFKIWIYAGVPMTLSSSMWRRTSPSQAG